MTQRNGHGIGGVGRLERLGQPEESSHHLADLDFVGPAPPGHCLLDLVGRIFGHIAPCGGGLGHHDSAHHANGHCCAHIVLKKHPLDRHGLRAELGDQLANLSLKLGEPDRPFDRWIGANHSGRYRTRSPATFETAVAATRQTGINTKNEHMYDPSADARQRVGHDAWQAVDMSRRKKVLLAALAAGAVCFTALTLKLFRYPHTGLPERADAVVMLAGGGNRVDKAVELGAERGLAPVVAFSAVYVAEQGVWAARPCNQSGKATMKDTEALCFEPDPPTTRGEVREIARLAEEHGWKSVIVVASTDQVTRARMLLNRCWDGRSYFVGVPHSQPLIFRAAYEWGATLKALTVNRGC